MIHAKNSTQYNTFYSEFFFLQLDNGKLCVLPTNKIIFEDKSFTQPNNLKLKITNNIWKCE